MKQSAEHNQESFLRKILCLTKINPVVFELTGYKQINKNSKNYKKNAEKRNFQVYLFLINISKWKRSSVCQKKQALAVRPT
jgi:hypothetical protein